VYYSDTGFNVNKFLEDTKKIDKPLESIIEYVFSASYLSAYVSKFNSVVKVSMLHLFTPSNQDKTIINEGKMFTEKLLLHRTIGIHFDRVDEGGNLLGRIYHPAGDIA
jgi:hypothetical protein